LDKNPKKVAKNEKIPVIFDTLAKIDQVCQDLSIQDVKQQDPFDPFLEPCAQDASQVNIIGAFFPIGISLNSSNVFLLLPIYPPRKPPQL
jgi:hypothetical protein